jgi:histidine kinase/DNA gyrase B/HSP90-like ATPase
MPPTTNNQHGFRPLQAGGPRPATSKPVLPKLEAARIGFHEGNVLGQLARTYPFLDEAVFEAVQNSIDAGARKITVSINKMPSARNITICDDGNGADDQFFRNCIASIGESKKTAGKIGQFGLGIVASYAKCDYFTFTSEPANGKNGMLEWTFDCAALKAMGKGLEAPVREVKLAQKEWWRSKLHIEKFETDKIRASIDLDTICDGILSRYNEHLRPHKTKVTVKVTEADGSVNTKTIEAIDYTGSPLPVKVYESETSGRTEVRLFLAKTRVVNRVAGYHGIVRVKSGNNSGIILNEKNADKAVAGLLKKDVLSRLTSGVFEGIINFDGEKVRMDPSRIRMVESDELLDACSKIERWMEEVGQAHIDKIEDQTKGERYERLGDRSLKMLNTLFKNDSDVGKLLRSWKLGTKGAGHADVGQETGETIKARSIEGKADPSAKPKQDDQESRDHKPTETDRPDHAPLTVASDKGNTRKLVKNNSLGLTVVYGPIKGTWMWELDPDRGFLRINIFHPLWSGVESAHSNKSACEKCLMDLQERIILSALRLHQWEAKFTNADGELDANFLFVEESIKTAIMDEIPLIIHADKLTKRGQFYNRIIKKGDSDATSSNGKEE